jgi:hypothetical protein
MGGASKRLFLEEFAFVDEETVFGLGEESLPPAASPLLLVIFRFILFSFYGM